MYSHLTEIEADYRRDRVAQQFHNAQRHTRPRHQERRWHVGRRHTA